MTWSVALGLRLVPSAFCLRRSRSAGWLTATISVMKVSLCFLAIVAAATSLGGEIIPLTSLDLAPLRQGWGAPQVDRAVTGKPLSIAGHPYLSGVGTHARSMLWVDLGGTCERFQAWVGVDDGAGSDKASVRFQVVADGEKLFDSGVLHAGQAAARVDVPLAGRRQLVLLALDAGDGIDFDHADWAEAKFLVASGHPVSIPVPEEEPVVLTPPPGPEPRINGPAVYGCRPGNPFLYRVPTTGERPIRFTAAGLPEGLQLDAERGILSGITPPAGRYDVTFQAENRHGTAARTFQIVAGDQLALTPPMGWNHWYAHYNRITDAMMREAADIMVRTGLADVGYQYVSIDDCWMNAPKHEDPLRVGPLRDENGEILCNRHFPDMPALTAHIHAYGLKAGIYTSPGPFTCAGFAGTYGHEEQDARTFARWGFDLLKYDWCSYGQVATGEGRERLMKPYRQMGDILRRLPRDIVLNLCQYGMGDVWEWGAEVGGQSWRTAGDLGFELNRVFEVALKNAKHRDWNGPGAWNDPDYIQIGHIGNARGMGEPVPCPLSPNEQYAFMSLWCLMAAPLFYSGDMASLDAFTLNVLGNPELIAVNQDPLGQCARVIELNEEAFLMIKDLADGTKALGLFNRGEFATRVTAEWNVLGLAGPQQLRDLWRQKDLGRFTERYSKEVPRRGCIVLRVKPAD